MKVSAILKKFVLFITFFLLLHVKICFARSTRDIISISLFAILSPFIESPIAIFSGDSQQ